jgi:hypothetical protein
MRFSARLEIVNQTAFGCSFGFWRRRDDCQSYERIESIDMRVVQAKEDPRPRGSAAAPYSKGWTAERRLSYPEMPSQTSVGTAESKIKKDCEPGSQSSVSIEFEATMTINWRKERTEERSQFRAQPLSFSRLLAALHGFHVM